MFEINIQITQNHMDLFDNYKESHTLNLLNIGFNFAYIT